MAGKTYYATTNIKFGSRDGSEADGGRGKYESKTFKPGDKVVGLSVEDMKGLWAAGALTEEAPKQEEAEAPAEKQEDPEDPKTPAAPKTPAGTRTAPKA